MSPQVGVESSASNRSAERALAILDEFQGRSPLRVSEIVERTGLGQSTASRLLQTLEHAGYLARTHRRGEYTLGSHLLPLASAALNHQPLYRAARETIHWLAFTTGLGCNLASFHGDTLQYLLNVEGIDAPRDHSLAGRTLDLVATGIGKCAVAFAEPSRRDELLTGFPFVAHTEHTLTSREDLDQEIQHIRSAGYAVEREELAHRRACIAAPLFLTSGAVAGYLSLSGPLSVLRVDEREKELSTLLMEAADRVSLRLVDVDVDGRA